MTDNNDDTNLTLSRRKILGAAGTVGAAGALGGAATTGLLWDEEKFGNATDPNVLQAGTLDLKVDWEEHYSDWSGAETEVDGVRMLEEGESPESDEVGLPTPANAMIAVSTEDTDGDGTPQIEEYMDSTAIEAYPDNDDDGVQDDISNFDFCANGADLPDDLDSSLRTDSERGAPLIDLMDVKPGDFGELTLSFHICDNPAYVTLTGDLVKAAENGITEPEGGADDEDGEDETYTDLSEARQKVELLDAIETAWWYDDNCNNRVDGNGGGGGQADVVIVLDRSGSMTFEAGKFQAAKDGAKTLVDALGPGANIGLVSFGGNVTMDAPLGTSRSQIKSEIQSLNSGGGTPIAEAINAAQSELTGPNSRSGSSPVMVLLTNGSPTTGDPRPAANNAKNAGTTIYGIAYGSGANEDVIEDISSPPKQDDGSITSADKFAFLGDQANIGNIFDDIGQQISVGETVFFQDTLGAALELLSEGFVLDSDPGTDNKDCFAPSSTQCIGFAWWLPRDIPGMNDNAVQTDSVKFNFGFEAIQCRHNPVGNDGEPIDSTIQEADSDA